MYKLYSLSKPNTQDRVCNLPQTICTLLPTILLCYSTNVSKIHKNKCERSKKVNNTWEKEDLWEKVDIIFKKTVVCDIMWWVNDSISVCKSERKSKRERKSEKVGVVVTAE